MNVYPVVMCGGAGTRLWPSSRPSWPKPFIPLAGKRSLFQETILRVAPLASGGGKVIVVGSVAHRELILEQLDQIGVDAQILLEPEARDSAPAMAAAAAWTEDRDPEAVNVFVASDHHVPDAKAFREAVIRAAQGARDGRIVTLGIKPTSASEAYGYIRPSGEGLASVEAFVEKPDRTRAADYIRRGYLWNSGNFISSAAMMLSELRAYEPEVEAAARAALEQAGGDALVILGDAFRAAPKISIDYAVMERTRRASVLGVDFGWSDLGSWDAMAASGEAEVGGHVFLDAEGCVARAADGMLVAALGVRNLAIIAERDAVLVCDLSRAQEVKQIVERVSRVSPGHVDFPPSDPQSFAENIRWFEDWIRLRALPVWSALGQTEDGAFAQRLAHDGGRIPGRRSARVQAGQICALGRAGVLGWGGQWRRAVEGGLRDLDARFLRPDGLVRAWVDEGGEASDEAAPLSDQALVLLAWAAAVKAGAAGASLEARAARLRDRLLAKALEDGEHLSTSGRHGRLLEAALAWMELGVAPEWRALAERLARPDIDAESVEPGSQFEAAWVLARYGKASGNLAAIEAGERLYEQGRAALSRDLDGFGRTKRLSLESSAERLRAALLLSRESPSSAIRGLCRDDTDRALRALRLRLAPSGLWTEDDLSTGAGGGEAVSASVFREASAELLHHLMAAYEQMVE